MTSPRKSPPVLTLVTDTVELPTMPEVLVKLNEALTDPDASAADAAAIVSRDPALAANLLRIVNSAYFGLQVRVSGISLAISVLGFNMTRKIALRAAVFSTFARRRDRIQHFDATGFWRHAIFAGVATRVLGAHSTALADSHGEDLHIAGLLHDIGKIILLERMAPRYLAMLRCAAAEEVFELEVEQREFGFTHADVGSALAVKWSLPEDLALAIRHHHVPSHAPSHRPLSALVHLADSVAWSAGRPSTRGTRQVRLDPDVYDRLGLTPDQVEQLLPQIEEDFAASEMPW